MSSQEKPNKPISSGQIELMKKVKRLYDDSSKFPHLKKFYKNKYANQYKLLTSEKYRDIIKNNRETLVQYIKKMQAYLKKSENILVELSEQYLIRDFKDKGVAGFTQNVRFLFDNPDLLGVQFDTEYDVNRTYLEATRLAMTFMGWMENCKGDCSDIDIFYTVGEEQLGNNIKNKFIDSIGEINEANKSYIIKKGKNGAIDFSADPLAAYWQITATLINIFANPTQKMDINILSSLSDIKAGMYVTGRRRNNFSKQQKQPQKNPMFQQQHDKKDQHKSQHTSQQGHQKSQHSQHNPKQPQRGGEQPQKQQKQGQKKQKKKKHGQQGHQQKKDESGRLQQVQLTQYEGIMDKVLFERGMSLKTLLDQRWKSYVSAVVNKYPEEKNKFASQVIRGSALFMGGFGGKLPYTRTDFAGKELTEVKHKKMFLEDIRDVLRKAACSTGATLDVTTGGDGSNNINNNNKNNKKILANLENAAVASDVARANANRVWSFKNSNSNTIKREWCERMKELIRGFKTQAPITGKNTDYEKNFYELSEFIRILISDQKEEIEEKGKKKVVWISDKLIEDITKNNKFVDTQALENAMRTEEFPSKAEIIIAKVNTFIEKYDMSEINSFYDFDEDTLEKYRDAIFQLIILVITIMVKEIQDLSSKLQAFFKITAEELNDKKGNGSTTGPGTPTSVKGNPDEGYKLLAPAEKQKVDAMIKVIEDLEARDDPRERERVKEFKAALTKLLTKKSEQHHLKIAAAQEAKRRAEEKAKQQKHSGDKKNRQNKSNKQNIYGPKPNVQNYIPPANNANAGANAGANENGNGNNDDDENNGENNGENDDTNVQTYLEEEEY